MPSESRCDPSTRDAAHARGLPTASHTGRRAPRPAAGAHRAAALAVCSPARRLRAGAACQHRPSRGDPRELAEAQTFPYFPVYWAGPRFGALPACCGGWAQELQQLLRR